jgi:hypothetical protein
MTPTLNGARVFPNIREAIHATATGVPSMKVLAGELDMSPSELSHRTTLGGDSGKSFPADDTLVNLMRATENYSILATLADLCGFELQPKRERTAELLTEVQGAIKALMPRMQLVLELSGGDEKKSERKR